MHAAMRDRFQHDDHNLRAAAHPEPVVNCTPFSRVPFLPPRSRLQAVDDSKQALMAEVEQVFHQAFNKDQHQSSVAEEVRSTKRQKRAEMKIFASKIAEVMRPPLIDSQSNDALVFRPPSHQF